MLSVSTYSSSANYMAVLDFVSNQSNRWRCFYFEDWREVCEKNIFFLRSVLTIPLDVASPSPAALSELMWWWYEAVGGGAGGGGPETNPWWCPLCWYQWLMAWWGCRAGLRWGWVPPMPPPKPPPPKPLLSMGFIMSLMTPPNDRQEPPPFFFLLLDDSFLFLVWMPSFFIVSGLFTCNKRKFGLQEICLSTLKSEV